MILTTAVPLPGMLILRRCCFSHSWTGGLRRAAGVRPPTTNLLFDSAFTSPTIGSDLSEGWCTSYGGHSWSVGAETTIQHNRRCYSKNNKQGGADNSNSSSSTDQHKLFLEQLNELNQERETLFGQEQSSKNGDPNNDDDIKETAERVIRDVSSLQSIDMTGGHEDKTAAVAATTASEIETLKNARQELYGFTEQEELSWSNAGGTHRHSAAFLRELEQARREKDEAVIPSSDPFNNSLEEVTPPSPAPNLTHVASDGQSVHMVDVGAKLATRRTAIAQTLVVFPDEVLEAFSRQQGPNKNELNGPKGPIFSTAILAGIMASKQTSNLIPLCHPLPLEQVNITIEWRTRNTIAIQCCCRVTHKTGVEMEALTGATIAALTVYDMVKAISHNVEIQHTRILHKDGGRRFVDKR